MRVSEIRVKRIRVNQELGVYRYRLTVYVQHQGSYLALLTFLVEQRAEQSALGTILIIDGMVLLHQNDIMHNALSLWT